MNLFYLSRDPVDAAQQHCDKHVVKMILEYAQLLSCAHRLLDGSPVTIINPITGKPRKFYLLDDERIELVRTVIPATNEEPEQVKIQHEIVNPVCYRQSHMNHPVAVWCREATGNYKYLYDLFMACCIEYTHRYHKIHSAERINFKLQRLPSNLPEGVQTDPPPSMPDEYKVDDVVISYQNLYVGSKSRFAKWTDRDVPIWFQQRFPNYDQTNFTRTNRVPEGPLQGS